MKLNALPKNIRTCATCGKKYYRRGNRIFKNCSIVCKGKSQIGIPSKKSAPTRVILKCLNCGKEVRSWQSKVVYHCSHKCAGKSVAKKISGDKHYNWKGGISPENQKQRNSIESREWKLLVFKRDGFRCRKCGICGGWNKKLKKRIILNAHHVKSWAKYPNLRFVLSNGKTLCVSCHKKTRNYKNNVQ